MDEIDIALSFMLLQNSRIPYRALAEKLNLSVNAVHKRIQTMVEAGVIRGFTAQASLKVTGSLLARALHHETRRLCVPSERTVPSGRGVTLTLPKPRAHVSRA